MINIRRSSTSVVLEIKSDEGGKAFYRFDNPEDLLDIGITLMKDSLLLAADRKDKNYPFDGILDHKNVEEVVDDFRQHIESEIFSDPNFYTDLELAISDNNCSDNDNNNSDSDNNSSNNDENDDE